MFRSSGVVQFGLRIRAGKRAIPSFAQGGSSLRLKSGSAQDDSPRVRVKLHHYRFSGFDSEHHHTMRGHWSRELPRELPQIFVQPQVAHGSIDRVRITEIFPIR